MLSVAIPLMISPIFGYLIAEIYEKAEKNLVSRKKYFSKLIITQFIILIILLTIINLYLEKILYLWLGNNINVFEVSSFLVPLSIIQLSIYIINSLKILFIAENKITLIKKALVFVFYLFIFLTIVVYKKFISIESYLYYYSISIFLLMIYFCYIFFYKKQAK